jgi:hypothetical protein
MSDNENRPGYYVDELQERIAELEAENERLEAERNLDPDDPDAGEWTLGYRAGYRAAHKALENYDDMKAMVWNVSVELEEAHERISKLETALQLIVDYPGTKGVMLKRFIAVAQKALEQEN